jgi:agmatinase
VETSQTAAGQQSAFAYLRHGQTPFFRLPSAARGEAGEPAYADADAVLLGVPWDGGTPVQAGARLGPYHVRRASAFVQTFHPSHRLDVFAALRAVDGGNVAFPPSQPAVVRAQVEAEVARIVAAGALPFLVGGDHSVALPALRAVAARHGPLAVVHVDAHLDTSDGELWGDAFHHGTPLRHALREGLVARGQLFQIGIRASSADAAEAEYPVQFGARGFSIDALAARGAATVAAEVRRAVGDRPVYLTFDVDAVDPAFAPGTGSPVPGGMSAREALALIRALAGVKLVGMDVVEVCPPLDHAEITSHLAAHVLFEGLAIAVLGRRPLAA